MSFLIGIALIVNYYENREVGPNFYQLLSIARDFDTTLLKSAKRKASLIVHPDKTGLGSDSITTFTYRRIQLAYSVLSQPRIRHIYNILGEKFALFAVNVDNIDVEVILTHTSFKFVKLLIITLYLTFSEQSGRVVQMCMFGLLVLFVIELFIVIISGGMSLNPTAIPIQAASLPFNFLTSGNSCSNSNSSSRNSVYNGILSCYLYICQITPYEFLTLCHHLYPAFVHCVKCVSGAFYIEPRKSSAFLLQKLCQISEDNTTRIRDKVIGKLVQHNVLSQSSSCAV